MEQPGRTPLHLSHLPLQLLFQASHLRFKRMEKPKVKGAQKEEARKEIRAGEDLTGLVRPAKRQANLIMLSEGIGLTIAH